MVRQSLEAKARDDPDFWSAVGLIELQVYEAMAAHKLSEAARGIQVQYEDLHRRVKPQWMWASVYDQTHFVLQNYNGGKRETTAAAALIMSLEAMGGHNE
jgi:hypothetical protein